MPDNDIGGSYDVHVTNFTYITKFISKVVISVKEQEFPFPPTSPISINWLMFANVINMKWSLIVFIHISWMNRKIIGFSYIYNLSCFLILNYLFIAFIYCMLILSISLILILLKLYDF